MKREDLIRAIDTIAPSGALRARVLALPARPRARLENLRPILSLGAAALLCAGVVFAVLALKNMAVPGSDNAGFNALSGGTETSETTAAPETQAPEATPDADNAQSAGPGEVESPTPAQPSDNAAQTPCPTPNSSSGLKTKTELPEGMLSPDDAIAKAKAACAYYYGIDATDCVVVDMFSYQQPTVYGTGELWEPLWKQDMYAGKKILLCTLVVPEDMGRYTWAFELQTDGAYKNPPAGATVVKIVMDAKNGDIIDKGMGALSGPMPTPTPRHD